MLACPKCRKPLQPLEYRGIILEACERCGGIWFDEGELRKIKESGPEAWLDLESRIAPKSEDATAVAGHSAPFCPKCNTPMQPYRFLYDSEVTLDECLECGGVWVDDTELAAMSEYVSRLQTEGTTKASEELGAVTSEAVLADKARRRGISGFLSAFRSIGRRPPPSASP